MSTSLGRDDFFPGCDRGLRTHEVHFTFQRADPAWVLPGDKVYIRPPESGTWPRARRFTVKWHWMWKPLHRGPTD